MSRSARCLSVFVLLIAPSLFAATRTWTGTNSGLWSDAGNWGGVAVAAGDDLIFPGGASNLATSNDLAAGTTFQSISANDAYTLAGNSIVLGSGGITSTSNPVTISLPLQLGASQVWTNTAALASQVLLISGDVQLSGFTLTLGGGANPSVGRIDGVISGAGAIVKTGANSWALGGANTYTGQTIINSGSISVSVPNGLGNADNTIANGTIVNSGGGLVLGNVTLATEYIRLFGTGPGCCQGALQALGGPSTTLTGTLELASADTRLYTEMVTLALNGVVTGSGRLGLNGDHIIALGNAANDFTGPVEWLGGVTLRLDVNQALPAGKAINVVGGTFDVNGRTQSIASLAGVSSTVRLNGGNLTIAGPGTTTFAGDIQLAGTVNLTGGQLTLTANNTFTGALNINGGSLRIVGGSVVAPIVQSSGELGISNNGTAGAVTVNGGTFRPGPTPAFVGFTGPLVLGPGATYHEPIDGTAVGTFGRITVTGAVDLGGSTLVLSGTATSVALGNQFTVIENDGADSVTGTFAGLPEGATISGGPGNFNYVISYIGGTGNDVVLTAATAPTATTVDSSQNPSTVGQSVTFTATVTPLAGSGTPTGTVTFRDGIVDLATVALAGGSATFSTSALALGSHVITVVYNGDATYLTSTSAPLTQNVLAAPAIPSIPALDPLHLTALALLLGAIAMVVLRR